MRRLQVMLFQMCYGPEIESIYSTIHRHPGVTTSELKEWFQYNLEGDISSLIEGTINFLKDINFIKTQDKRLYSKVEEWNITNVLTELNLISTEEEEESLNYIFTRMYYELFIKSDELFIEDIYYETNLIFNNSVGQEKINAWKRMMEFFGLGYRVYGGFYALPHPSLLIKIIEKYKGWEGPVQTFCQSHLSTIIPCEYKGRIYKGVVYGLQNLHTEGVIQLQYKQDLPYTVFQESQGQWNWIKIKEEF